MVYNLFRVVKKKIINTQGMVKYFGPTASLATDAENLSPDKKRYLEQVCHYVLSTKGPTDANALTDQMLIDGTISPMNMTDPVDVGSSLEPCQQQLLMAIRVREHFSCGSAIETNTIDHSRRTAFFCDRLLILNDPIRCQVHETLLARIKEAPTLEQEVIADEWNKKSALLNLIVSIKIHHCIGQLNLVLTSHLGFEKWMTLANKLGMGPFRTIATEAAVREATEAAMTEPLDVVWIVCHTMSPLLRKWCTEKHWLFARVICTDIASRKLHEDFNAVMKYFFSPHLNNVTNVTALLLVPSNLHPPKSTWRIYNWFYDVVFDKDTRNCLSTLHHTFSQQNFLEFVTLAESLGVFVHNSIDEIHIRLRTEPFLNQEPTRGKRARTMTLQREQISTRINGAQDDVCNICLDDVFLGVLTDCCHRFWCIHCLLPWLKNHTQCPVCKYHLQPWNLHLFRDKLGIERPSEFVVPSLLSLTQEQHQLRFCIVRHIVRSRTLSCPDARILIIANYSSQLTRQRRDECKHLREQLFHIIKQTSSQAGLYRLTSASYHGQRALNDWKAHRAGGVSILFVDNFSFLEGVLVPRLTDVIFWRKFSNASQELVRDSLCDARPQNSPPLECHFLNMHD